MSGNSGISCPSSATGPLTVGPVAAAPSLKKLAVGATIWTVGGQMAQMFIRLSGNLVLSRLLFPEAFGLMVLVGVFMGAIKMFSDIGIKPNIIQSERGDDPAFLNTAWTISVIRGGGLWLAACLLAWPFALFYGESQLAYLLPVTGGAAFLLGLQSTAVATLNKHLAVRLLTTLDVVSQGLGLVVMIAWAVVWPSVWALVAGGVAAALARAVLSHVMLPGIRNRFQMDRDALRSLYTFGRWVLISTVITFLARQLDRIMLGKLVSMEVLGVYGIAVVWSLAATDVLERIAHVVVLPLYAKLKAAGRDLSTQSARLRRPVQVAGGVVATMLIVSGHDLVAVMYDDRYLAAGRMLQVMGAAAWLQALAMNYTPAALALGRADWTATCQFARLISVVVAVPVGFYCGQQWLPDTPVIGVIAGLVLADIPRYLALLIPLRRCRMASGLDDLAFTVLIAVTAAAGLLVGRLAPGWHWPHPVAVAAAPAVAMLPWLVVATLSYQFVQRAAKAGRTPT